LLRIDVVLNPTARVIFGAYRDSRFRKGDHQKF